MELHADINVKKSITKKVIRNTKHLNVIRIISIVFVCGSVVLSMIHLILNLLFPQLNEVRVNGVYVMDMYSVISHTLLIIVLCLFFALAAHSLLANLSSRDISERSCEELFINDDAIRYVFRTRNQTPFVTLHMRNNLRADPPTDRVIFSIPYQDVTNCVYNKAVQRITFYGTFSSDVIDDYDKSLAFTPQSKNQKQIIIYDYFSPSLLESIQTKIKIKQEL